MFQYHIQYNRRVYTPEMLNNEVLLRNSVSDTPTQTYKIKLNEYNITFHQNGSWKNIKLRLHKIENVSYHVTTITTANIGLDNLTVNKKN